MKFEATCMGFNRKFGIYGMRFGNIPVMFQVAGIEFQLLGIMSISLLVRNLGEQFEEAGIEFRRCSKLSA